MTKTPLDLEEIAKAADAATGGPWLATASNRPRDGVAMVVQAGDRSRALAMLGGSNAEQRHNDAQFMAAARTWVPQLAAELIELRRQRLLALDVCDRMMDRTLSPSYIVAMVREALGWEMPPPPPRPFIGCRLPCGPGKWCGLKIVHDGDCVGVPADELPPSADDVNGAPR